MSAVRFHPHCNSFLRRYGLKHIARMLNVVLGNNIMTPTREPTIMPVEVDDEVWSLCSTDLKLKGSTLEEHIVAIVFVRPVRFRV